MDIRLDHLNKTIINCKKCPRLVEHIRKVSTTKRKKNINEIYWGKPVPGFGNLNSKMAFKLYFDEIWIKRSCKGLKLKRLGYKCKNLLDQEGGVKPYLIKDISGNPKLAGSL